MKTICTLILSFTTMTINAQQWVIDDIANEQKSSKPIASWFLVLLFIIGFFVYKLLSKKDEKATEKFVKEKQIEEEIRIEEELYEYREEHEDDDIEIEDDDIIIPSIPVKEKKETSIESIQTKMDNLSSNIETDKYILSSDSKQLIQAKDCASIVIPNSVEIIKSWAFSNAPNINTVIIPHSVRVIEAFAFSGCSIKKITIPNSIIKFGTSLFHGCSSLTEVLFEEGLQTFGDSMFSNCTSLETVKLPNTLISIPDSAFDTCISLSKIELPPMLKKIGDDAFCNSSLCEINIPSTVNDIGFSAFRGCLLSKISIPNQISGISKYMFYEDNNLKKVILPNTITCIMSHAFAYCEYLHIVIPPSVSYIAPDAFSQCNDYCYENLHIEVPKGKRAKLEKICDKLIGKITEYEVTADMKIPSDISTRKKHFIDYYIFKEKEELRNEGPIFMSNGAQVVFEYSNNCKYNNFE